MEDAVEDTAFLARDPKDDTSSRALFFTSVNPVVLFVTTDDNLSASVFTDDNLSAFVFTAL